MSKEVLRAEAETEPVWEQERLKVGSTLIPHKHLRVELYRRSGERVQRHEHLKRAFRADRSRDIPGPMFIEWYAVPEIIDFFESHKVDKVLLDKYNYGNDLVVAGGRELSTEEDLAMYERHRQENAKYTELQQ